jgi:phage terminase large subunit
MTIPLNPEQRKQIRERAPKDPVWWINKVLTADLWSAQKTIIEAVRDNPRTSARSCHGIGKSFLAGNTALWFLYTFPYSIVLTTAPTWRQVEKLVWKEIRSSVRKSKIDLGGELAKKSPELQIVQDEWVALGLSTNQPERFQGFHAKHLLVIVDEGAGVKEDIYEAIEGVLTSAHCRLLLLGNPTLIGGTFYRSHREPGWKAFHVAAWDTPNFTVSGITEEDLESGVWQDKAPKNPDGSFNWPHPYLITPEWAAGRLKAWGKNHPAYQARVAGNFPTQGENNVIPLAWIEAAMARWDDALASGSTILGVDVARFGQDLSAIAPRKGSKIFPLQIFAGKDTQEMAGECIRTLRETGADQINVDVIGLGAGVVDALQAAGAPVVAVNVAESSIELDDTGNKVFANLRAQLWWALRDALDPKNPEPLALPPDEDLLGDLAAPTYKINAKGAIQIEPKEETKKRLGRSPDRGDAVILTLAPRMIEIMDVGEPVTGSHGYSGIY